MEALVTKTGHADVLHERGTTRKKMQIGGGGVHVGAEDGRDFTIERAGHGPLLIWRHCVYLYDRRWPRWKRGPSRRGFKSHARQPRGLIERGTVRENHYAGVLFADVDMHHAPSRNGSSDVERPEHTWMCQDRVGLWTVEHVVAARNQVGAGRN